MWNAYFIPFSLSAIHHVLHRSMGQYICLVLLQKKVVCLNGRAKRLDNTSCLFSELCILKVQDIVEIRTALIMYKANNNLLPVNIQKLFILYKSVYITRQSPT